ncbi:unnamed protein product [Somion occarium]|uniref:DNA-(apurinic or apyrimidinic site) lyase n=1 Tax=Somion occarium TaxID=3059160 RepID=A0ABP1DB56_9APHY
MTITLQTGFRALPLPLAQLSLAAVLQCGQSFRWSVFPLSHNIPNATLPQFEYRLCLRDRVVCLRQSTDTLFYRAVFPTPASLSEEIKRSAETLAWLRDYFQLDVDLLKLYDEWGELDPVIKRLKGRFEGIRMLRQDPFECLLSFICSSNNNISRITKMVKALCTEFSPALLSLPSPELEPQERVHAYHPFPPPSVLAKPEVSITLRKLGFGYRAEFIQRTAQMLVEVHGAAQSSYDTMEPAEKWLLTLRSLPTAQAREELLKFVGVGRKVADCILLMSLDKREVVPVDTHVHQIAVKHYGMTGSSKTRTNMTPKLYDEVNNKLASIWGEYAGWAHSVLFTSDLKSFSTYGLLFPSPSESPSRPSEVPLVSSVVLPPTPSPSPSKRKRGQTTRDIETSNDKVSVLKIEDVPPEELTSLAERVKRRRRTPGRSPL